MSTTQSPDEPVDWLQAALLTERLEWISSGDVLCTECASRAQGHVQAHTGVAEHYCPRCREHCWSEVMWKRYGSRGQWPKRR